MVSGARLKWMGGWVAVAWLLWAPSEALCTEPEAWPAQETPTAVSIAVGWTHIYDYEAPRDVAIGHHVARVNGQVYTGRWLFELDGQWMGVGRAAPSLFLDGVIGYRVYQGPRAPSLWFTGDVAAYGKGPGGTLASMPPASGGVGVQLQMPLAHLDDGEARWAVRWHPVTGLYYKTMHVGWRVGPVGLRIGGLGLRDKRGRVWSGFTAEMCFRFGLPSR